MTDFRPVLYVMSILLLALSAFMLVPAATDFYYDNPDWKAFLISAAFTGFVGLAVYTTNKGEVRSLDVRQAFLLTSGSWVVLTVFAAIPLKLSDPNLTLVDAWFESVSGITTTGSTVISNLELHPPGFLLWRSLLQWLGGVGIIVMAVSVLPMLRVGGMQFFHMEFSARAEKVLPRTSEISINIGILYTALTALCAFLLILAGGMSPFDAINHAMTTVATGGYSTYDASIKHFDSATVDWIITTFMILAGLPFLLYLRMVKGDFLALYRDAQVRGFLWFIVMVVILVSYSLYSSGVYNDLSETLRYSAFNAVSLMTGTGYATADYTLWGGFVLNLLIVVMFVGGCVGSTCCGIKIFRFQVLAAHTSMQFRRLLEPHGVFVPHYNKQPIEEGVTFSVLSFFYMYIFSFMVLSILLSLTGLDFMTAFSGAASAISNVGPAAGDIIGPTGNFAPLNDAAKLLLCAGMLLGRLELFTIMVLFLPSFWRD